MRYIEILDAFMLTGIVNDAGNAAFDQSLAVGLIQNVAFARTYQAVLSIAGDEFEDSPVLVKAGKKADFHAQMQANGLE